jgi:glycerol-3-phosphate dehydrogenase
MAETRVDLLVIGGGITGSGIALDAASRGMKVALVEKDDFAAGTSGRSSRLIHGGLRYLAQYDFGVVHESLRERAILRRIAPHLVRPVPMYLPLPHLVSRMYVRLGLIVYHALAVGRTMGRHRVTGTEELHEMVPGLGSPSKALSYTEARTDDARLTMEVARTAHLYGAHVANHAVVRGLLGDGRVTGAAVEDLLTGERFDIRSRLTVNAAGVWAEGVQAMAGVAPRKLRPSKGIHLVFAPGAVQTRVGLSISSGAHDKRFVFIVPWGDRVYAGTTDTAYEGTLDEPTATVEDVAYVFGAVQAAFPAVRERDIVASWAGLRPLLDTEAARDEPGATKDLSRRHAIYGGPSGLLTITGGKLTAYRAMAEEVVDRAAEELGFRARCKTKRIPLGMRGSVAKALQRSAAESVELGFPPDVGHRFMYRFGDDWPEAMKRVREDPSLGEPVVEGLPVRKVEVALARSREMAITDDDVLIRRTRLTTLDERKATQARV